MSKKRKVLISWIAYNHDFMPSKEGQQINVKGTHSELYTYLFNYDVHLLLSGSSENNPDLKFRGLLNHLKQTYNKNTLPQYLDIEDIVSIDEIKTKLFPILLDYKEEHVEVFISPGTPSMQTVWYLLAMEFKNVKLFQVRPPKFRIGNPEKIYIKVKHLGISNGLTVLEKDKRKNVIDQFIFTPTIKTVFDKADKIASSDDVTTLILGETGTGKEVIAKYIHRNSRRN